MKATTRAIVVSLGLAIVAAGAAAAQTPAAAAGAEPLTLERLHAMALENNPTLKQAAAEIQAAKGRALQAGLLPNPVIGYTGEEISSGPVIRGGEHGFFIEQTIPLGGKLRLSRSVFEREATQAEALAEAQRFRVLNSVRILYYQALLAQRRVELHERLARVTREAVGVSAQLFNVGAADRPDYLESEIEERRAQVELTTARNTQSRIWRQLAAVVGEPSLGPRPLAGELDGVLPEFERERVRETVLRDSPELKAARAAIERAELALRRARREPVPDLILRGGPRYNRELLEIGFAGNVPVGWEAAVDVGLTIPLFNRNQGNVAAARAELGRARAELRRLELSLEARLAVVFDEYLTALRSAEIYRTEVLPRAEQAYELYLARFREMAAAYPQVLVAQRTLVQVSDEYLEALDTAWQAAVALEGLLLTDGLQAPPRPGDGEPGMPGRAVMER